MKTKRLLAAILAVAMILGMMSFPAFAEGNVAKIGESEYQTIQAAVNAAAANDTITVIADVSNEAVSVNKNVTITGSAALSEVSFNAVEGCNSLTVSGLRFTGNSWINSGEAGALTVSGVTANVTPNNTNCTNSRSAFISLGRVEQKELCLTVENCNIVSAGGSDPILGWAAIKEATITGNTFGAENAYQQNGDSVKFMSIAPDAVLTMTHNTVYSDYNGFVFSQNTTKGNAYTAIIENNTFKGEADHVWVEVTGATTTHAKIRAASNNTVNGKTFAVGDIKVHPNINNWTGYAGVDVVLDKDGKIISGTLTPASNKECLAEGFSVDAEGKVGSAVVQIGEKKFATLAAAVNAAADGDTVTLLSNVYLLTVGEGTGLVPQILIDKSITLDLAGYTIGYSDDLKKKELTYTPAFFTISDGADVTITGNGTINCEAGDNNAYGIDVDGGTLTIENGTFLGALTVVQVTQGSAVIKDGFFDLAPTAKAAAPQYAKYVINAIDRYWQDGTAVISVEGGIFVGFDPSANPENKDTSYVAKYSYVTDNGDGTYTVVPFTATVIDTAKTTGAEVTLDKLHNSSAVDPTEDATYKVVVAAAPAADVTSANTAIEKNNNDTNTSKMMFDISVVKLDSNGVETNLGGASGVTNQQVTLTLGETPKADTKIYVYHVDDSGIGACVAEVEADGTNTITFTAPSFSTYAVTYTAASFEADEITKNVGVVFERIGATSEYDIVLKALDGKKINRFMSADLTFEMSVTDGAVGYTICPAANVNLIDNSDGRYEFNLDGVAVSGVTGTDIAIGKIAFEGSGTVDFKVAVVDTNIVNTAKAKDNIVDNYQADGDGETTGKLSLNDELTNGVIDETFSAPTKDLTVNIVYNNAIENNEAAYQDMKVTISGGDLADALIYKLGSDKEDVVYADNTYTVVITDKLTQNVGYVVTIEGAGYRTARYTVNMTGDKTLNFWNNVKDTAVSIEEGNVGREITKNFLAGDIVKDNNINIYDLSAVVSYFGTDGLSAENNPAYAKYDLNRDGKIDSKDVAYVLVSWNQ